MNGSEPEFYFYYRDTWDDPTCEVLLKCKYSDADYSSELDRLKDGIELKGDDRKIETSILPEVSDIEGEIDLWTKEIENDYIDTI